MTSAMMARLANAGHGTAATTTYINSSNPIMQQQQQQQINESEFTPSPTPERLLAEPLPPNTPIGTLIRIKYVFLRC